MSKQAPEGAIKAPSQDTFSGATEVEKSDDPPTAAEESSYNNHEPSFDTGVLAWLQVLGSFFLWFNSWYV